MRTDSEKKVLTIQFQTGISSSTENMWIIIFLGHKIAGMMDYVRHRYAKKKIY